MQLLVSYDPVSQLMKLIGLSMMLLFLQVYNRLSPIYLSCQNLSCSSFICSIVSVKWFYSIFSGSFPWFIFMWLISCLSDFISCMPCSSIIYMQLNTMLSSQLFLWTRAKFVWLVVWLVYYCRWISISPELSFFPKVLLHVGIFLCTFSYSFSKILQHCSSNCALFCLIYRSVNEVICHGIPDARYVLCTLWLPLPFGFWNTFWKILLYIRDCFSSISHFFVLCSFFLGLLISWR